MRHDAALLLDHLPAAYVGLRRSDGRIVSANRSFLTLIGRSLDEVLALTLVEMLTVGGRIYYETHLMPLLEVSGRVDEVAVEVLTADVARVPVLLNAQIDHADEGSVDGDLVHVVLFEARERRRYETELLRATREAVAARREAVELARTLQQTLIPPVPPVIPHLGLSAIYRPAGAGDEVGGDFYDVFNVGEREWVVALGDVAGKGVAAATVTAFIRHQIRDLAMRVTDPGALLHGLDVALRAQQTDRFCTAVALRLRQVGASWTISGSAGGHPLPLLGRDDGTVVALGRPGSLIGILDEPVYETFHHTLVDGEFVTLYTDGVSEARHGGAMLGDAAVRALVTGSAHAPAEVSEVVVAAALDFQHGLPSDDMAVLTLWPS